MPGLQQISEILERALGTKSLPNHDYFWRGKTRNELVDTTVFGLPIVVPGRPQESSLLLAMQGGGGMDAVSAPLGAELLRRLFQHVSVPADDVALFEEWIRQDCPETATSRASDISGVGLVAEAVSDDTHLRYWRAVDDFFLPSLASPQTRPHVNRMHFAAFQKWVPARVQGGPLSDWTSYLGQPSVTESFRYIRHHQRRLITEFYGSSQSSLFDSLWKFGGNLLPEDELSNALPQHTMNGVLDWFFWTPYLDASLSDPEVQAVDVELARGWQLGIVADGLLRTDDDRPAGSRMSITDFSSSDPQLWANVLNRYGQADATFLIGEMVRRAQESNLFA